MQESIVACDAQPRVKNKACRSMAWSEMAETCHAGLLQLLSTCIRITLSCYFPWLISGSPTYVSRPSSFITDGAKVHQHSSEFGPRHVRETKLVYLGPTFYPRHRQPSPSPEANAIEHNQSREVTMCDWEEFIFTCGHSEFRLQSYCHYARNHPYHECRRVKKLRNCWDQGRPCDACAAEYQRQQAFFFAQGGGEGQGQ